MPIYDLSIADATGKPIPLGLRCKLSGLYTDMKWPDDYRIQVLPGDAYETTVDLSREIPASGTYSVSFRYCYDPTSKIAKEDRFITYPEDLWIGEAVSATKQLEFEK